MSIDPRTPVLVGVGQVTNRGPELVDPIIEYPHTRNDQPIGSSVIGGYVSQGNVDALDAKAVCGPANNPLADRSGAARLAEEGGRVDIDMTDRGPKVVVLPDGDGKGEPPEAVEYQLPRRTRLLVPVRLRRGIITTTAARTARAF